MTAAVVPLTIEAGATFTLGFNWHYRNPDGTVGDPHWTDPTGWEADMHIRRTPTSSEIYIDANTHNAKILLTANGRVDIRLEDLDTDLLHGKRNAYYDLEVRAPDGPPRTVNRLLEGPITIDPNTTRQ
jgi:hypothetical protein